MNIYRSFKFYLFIIIFVLLVTFRIRKAYNFASLIQSLLFKRTAFLRHVDSGAQSSRRKLGAIHESTKNLSYNNILPDQGINDLSSNSVEDIGLLKCSNQTRCISPILQLQRVYNVYLCKHINYGVRFFYLAKEGLLLHPKVRLVSRPEDAELIIYLPVSSEWTKSECSKSEYSSRLVVLDEGDGQGAYYICARYCLMFLSRARSI